MEEAKLAGLKAKKIALKKKHEIELKEAQLKQEKEEIEMDAEIAEGEARERVLGQYEEGLGNVAPAATPAVDCKQQIQVSNPPAGAVTHGDVKQGPPLIKIKPLPLPRFDGDPREYPRFRSDFLKQVAPRCATEALAYTLRTCLCRKAQEMVKVVDDDYEEMFRRLDEEYGDPSQAVDLIMSQIRRYRVPKEDGTKLVEFIEIVEKGYYDLKHLKMEHEMSNVGFVSLIESKLPDLIKQKWAERVCIDVDKRDKFPMLMKFLLETKRMTKYLASDVRTSVPSSTARYTNQQIKTNPPNRSLSHVRTMTGNVRSMNACFFCEGPHAIDKCEKLGQMTEEEKTGYVMSKGLCFGCLRGGHRSKDCKSRKTCERCHSRHPTALHREHIAGSSRREGPSQVVTGHTRTTGQASNGEPSFKL